MRQRNDTGYEKDVMRWPSEAYPDDHAFKAGVDEVVDRPYLIEGFTLVEDSLEAPEPEVKPKRKNATAVVDVEEGEAR